jgi:hypothetical protein
MTDFRKGLLWTAIPLVGTALLSTGGAFAPGLYFVWALPALGVLGSLAVALILAAMKRSELSGGVAAGGALGFLALAITCFANLSTA